MQKLEIILEEIRNSGITAVELFGREVPFVAMSEVERIILKHIHTEEILITEMCPHCGKETGISWDVNQDGYQVFCPNCGKPMMLCSMCDRLPCDWTEKGCKYSDDRYCANGGWIQWLSRYRKTGHIFVHFMENCADLKNHLLECAESKMAYGTKKDM